MWRRILVLANFTLRELHGVIQTPLGWEGIHLYNFHLRAERYGSWELAASSPDVTPTALRLRIGARSICEDDLNIPWRHEGPIEDRLVQDARKIDPVCVGADGASLRANDDETTTPGSLDPQARKVSLIHAHTPSSHRYVSGCRHSRRPQADGHGGTRFGLTRITEPPKAADVHRC